MLTSVIPNTYIILKYCNISSYYLAIFRYNTVTFIQKYNHIQFISINWLSINHFYTLLNEKLMAVMHKHTLHNKTNRTQNRTLIYNTKKILSWCCTNCYIILLSHGRNVTDNFVRQTRTGWDSGGVGFLNFFILSHSIINSLGFLTILYLPGLDFRLGECSWRGCRQFCKSYSNTIRAIQFVTSGKKVMTAVSSQNTIFHASFQSCLHLIYRGKCVKLRIKQMRKHSTKSQLSSAMSKV